MTLFADKPRTSPPLAQTLFACAGIKARSPRPTFSLLFFLFFSIRVQGFYVSCEGSPEATFLLVENYNYMTTPAGLRDRLGIFEE